MVDTQIKGDHAWGSVAPLGNQWEVLRREAYDNKFASYETNIGAKKVRWGNLRRGFEAYYAARDKFSSASKGLIEVDMANFNFVWYRPGFPAPVYATEEQTAQWERTLAELEGIAAKEGVKVPYERKEYVASTPTPFTWYELATISDDSLGLPPDILKDRPKAKEVAARLDTFNSDIQAFQQSLPGVKLGDMPADFSNALEGLRQRFVSLRSDMGTWITTKSVDPSAAMVEAAQSGILPTFLKIAAVGGVGLIIAFAIYRFTLPKTRGSN